MISIVRITSSLDLQKPGENRKLNPKILVLGPNGSGKTRFTNGLLLATYGMAYDTQARAEVKDGARISAMGSGQVQVEAKGSNGDTFSYTANDGKRPVHVCPVSPAQHWNDWASILTMSPAKGMVAMLDSISPEWTIKWDDVMAAARNQQARDFLHNMDYSGALDRGMVATLLSGVNSASKLAQSRIDAANSVEDLADLIPAIQAKDLVARLLKSELRPMAKAAREGTASPEQQALIAAVKGLWNMQTVADVPTVFASENFFERVKLAAVEASERKAVLKDVEKALQAAIGQAMASHIGPVNARISGVLADHPDIQVKLTPSLDLTYNGHTAMSGAQSMIALLSLIAACDRPSMDGVRVLALPDRGLDRNHMMILMGIIEHVQGTVVLTTTLGRSSSFVEPPGWTVIDLGQK